MEGASFVVSLLFEILMTSNSQEEIGCRCIDFNRLFHHYFKTPHLETRLSHSLKTIRDRPLASTPAILMHYVLDVSS